MRSASSPMVPVHGLNGIVPELFSEHLLKEPDYGAEGDGHPVVGLLEGDDEDMDILDLVLQRRHQALDSFLLLHLLVAWKLKQTTVLLASNIFLFSISIPKAGGVNNSQEVLPSLAMAAKLTSIII